MVRKIPSPASATSEDVAQFLSHPRPSLIFSPLPLPPHARSGFSPLTGFMNKEDYESVVADMRLKVSSSRQGAWGKGSLSSSGRRHHSGSSGLLAPCTPHACRVLT